MSEAHGLVDVSVVPVSFERVGDRRLFQATGTCSCGVNLGADSDTAHRAKVGLRIQWLKHVHELAAAS